jgi:hypothetical protein
MRNVDVAVARLLPQLAPAAVLLTDDPADAVRLLAAALSRPGALDSSDAAARALASAAVHRPRWTGDQVIGSLDPPPPDEDRALADALRSLPVAARVAVVLGDDTAAAGSLRAAVGRYDADAQRARARETADFRPPGAALPDVPLAPLPDRLTRLATGRSLPPDAASTIAAEVAAARGARRRRWSLLAAGTALVVALAVVAPRLPQEAPPAPEPQSVYDRATAGSLADDQAFLAVLRALLWPPAHTADQRRVVFAGDVPGGRYALVAAGGTPSRPAAIGWFAGPPGASADRLRLVSGQASPAPDQPTALTDPTTGTLVVVGAPQDQFQVSERPEISAEGTVGRTFTPVPSPGGVAVVGLTALPGTSHSSVRFQSAGDDPSGPFLFPAVVVPADDGTGTPPASRLRPAPPPAVGDAAVAPQLDDVLGRLGRSPRDTAVTTLWAGDLPGPNDRPARLTVVAVEQPTGAVVVTAPYGYAADPSGRAGSSWCVTGVLPAGEPLDRRVVAVRCDISDGTVDREVSRFLVVLGPRTATSVQLLDTAGAVLSEHPLSDGVAVVRSPGDVARVLVQEADGGSAGSSVLQDTDLSG